MALHVAAPVWHLMSIGGMPVTYPSGTVIYRHNARITHIYIIETGVVQLTGVSGEASPLIALRTAGWPLGAAEAIRHNTHVGTATTLSDCDVRAIAVKDFDHLRHTESTVSGWLQAEFASAICQLEEGGARGREDCRERLERLITDLLRAMGEPRVDGTWRMAPPMSVTSMAELLGLSRPWVSRCLGAWVASGALRRQKGWFVIPAESPFARRLAAERAGDGARIDRGGSQQDRRSSVRG
jgi:CRP-like cAMP-binding protein